MPMVGVNCVAPQSWSAAAPSLSLSPAVTMQLQLFCLVAVPMVAAVSTTPPAAGGGVPLAAALCRFCNGTLGRMVTELAQVCTPPLLARDRKSGAPPPPWWPTAKEEWWCPEVAAHLHGRPMATPVPFASPRRLTKAEKVAMIVSMVKHVAPDFGRLAAAASRSRLTELEASTWERALRGERERYFVMMPSFILLPPPPPPQHVDSAESAAHADPESESNEQTVDFYVSGEDAAHDPVEGEGKKPEDTAVPLLEQHGSEDHGRLHGDLAGELASVVARKQPAALLEQHYCDEGHDSHQQDNLSGEPSDAAEPAPEDVDWFDCDEVRRGLDELEIPSFFGGYYI
ncbi:hypothetical protein E2562_008772 [Oryza meyeriana var. granulata]|uniref:Ethylene insensitive 3-like DNA-binding domain-containing protein n=1 Tax=Oryza meyeriana var. granulata TaxID=110450 RepID=A0A6G1D1T8_9ORYZ|nr:hypothetical protein E2562_008772 [Oryza meyeriana var. granulata]